MNEVKFDKASEPGFDPAAFLLVPAKRFEDLKVGDIVWTLDAGARVATPLVEIGSTPVPATHRVVELRLSDGRAVDVAARDMDAAAARWHLTARDLERRRLPRAVRSEERDDIAARHGEVDAV